MGSCISKCRSKKRSKSKEEEEEEDCNYFVQDKVVISQQAPIYNNNNNNNILPNTKKPFSPSPSPPSPSSSSFSSFSCTTSNSTISSCSSSSSSTTSSVLSSKDRSFSNEFLWSCVKENPHIIPIKPISITNSSVLPVAKLHAQKLDSLVKSVALPTISQPIPLRVNGSSGSQKRARASSPTLTRQKSFRRETDQRSNCRTLMRSPSPSRRFTGDNYCRNIMTTSTGKESCCKSSVGSRTNGVHHHQHHHHHQHILSSVKKENLRPASPNKNSGRHRSCSKSTREMFSQQIGSKIDEVAIGEVLSRMEVDTLPMEDIDNPHISLDCFIFL